MKTLSTNKEKEKIIVVLGPTAAGKSDLAIQIAKDFKGEIISADSRQIYKGMDIASNKITTDEMQGIPHHLLDVVNPDQDYSLYNWQQDAFSKIKEILAKHKLPIIVGGTGLYICSVIQNYDMHPDQPSLRECPYDFIIFGLNPDLPRPSLRGDETDGKVGRDKLYTKINKRVDRMLNDGSIDEVKKIYHRYKRDPAIDGGKKYLENPEKSRRVNKKLTALTGIGYKQIIEYLENETSLEEAIEKIKQSTRNYAKRQMTWFRRMEKQGIKIHWNKNNNQIKKILH